MLYTEQIYTGLEILRKNRHFSEIQVKDKVRKCKNISLG